MRSGSRGQTRKLSAAVALTALTAVLGGVPEPTQAAAPYGGKVVQVNQDATTNYQNEPTIAINPVDSRNLVAGSIDNGQCAAYASTDRGKTWTHQVLPDVSSFTAAGDPVVAFDANGIAYFLCMNLSGGNGRTQYVFVSTDGGQNWLGPTLAIGSPATDDDKGAMAVDDHPSSPYSGNVYVAATRNPGTDGDLRFARSTTGGTSFELEQQVDDNTAIAFSASIAVGADGAVYVAWRNVTSCSLAGGCTTAIMLEKSTDGGATFGALSGGVPHAIRVGDIVDNGEVRPEPLRGIGTAVIATHPTDPNIVYAVWGENPAGIDDSDVMFSRSMDGGNTWQSPIRVNDDVNPPGEFFSQYFSTVAVDPSDGEIDIVWYSDQNDPNRTDGAPLVDVYFASSTDGGASFGPSVRVTTASSNPLGSFNDYIGIASLGGVAHPIWTDTTLGGEGDQDIATTQIGGADLHISKTALSDPAVAGRSLTYAISVSNDGPADAFNTIVTDTLPNGFTYVSNSVGCTQGSGGTLACALGDLQAGTNKSFEVTGVIAADLVFNAGGPVTITNNATVNSDQDDPNLSDNTATEDTLVKAVADVAIVSFEPVAPPTTVVIGHAIDLMLRKVVTNHGPSSPIDVALSRTATAPSGSTVTPAVSSSTATALTNGELRTVDESFTITCGAPGAQTFSFANTVAPANAVDVDPDLANNTATASVTVTCIVPVAINIRPGSFPNVLNLHSTTHVAVLTTKAGEYGLPLAFDATTIQPESIRFGPEALVFPETGGAPAFRAMDHIKDAQELDEKTKDKDLDMVLQFRVGDTGLTQASTAACVKGVFTGPGGGAYEFFGCDSVAVHP
jgi:uncharacterized repeat protein (TIGR01451 family)